MHRKRKLLFLFVWELRVVVVVSGSSQLFRPPAAARTNMEYKLIMAVSGFPSLYDTNSLTYRDLNMRSDAWRQVAEIVGVPGECVQMFRDEQRFCRQRWIRAALTSGEKQRRQISIVSITSCQDFLLSSHKINMLQPRIMSTSTNQTSPLCFLNKICILQKNNETF